MKELINWAADPIRSFPVVCVLFYYMMKYYRVVGTKKFLGWSLVFIIPVAIWFAADPNFFTIITLPDNIPIVILIVLIGFLQYLYAINRQSAIGGFCRRNPKCLWTLHTIINIS